MGQVGGSGRWRRCYSMHTRSVCARLNKCGAAGCLPYGASRSNDDRRSGGGRALEDAAARQQRTTRGAGTAWEAPPAVRHARRADRGAAAVAHARRPVVGLSTLGQAGGRQLRGLPLAVDRRPTGSRPSGRVSRLPAKKSTQFYRTAWYTYFHSIPCHVDNREATQAIAPSSSVIVRSSKGALYCRRRSSVRSSTCFGGHALRERHWAVDDGEPLLACAWLLFALHSKLGTDQ